MKKLNTQDPREMRGKALLGEFEQIVGDIVDMAACGACHYVDAKEAEKRENLLRAEIYERLRVAEIVKDPETLAILGRRK